MFGWEGDFFNQGVGHLINQDCGWGRAFGEVCANGI